MKVYALEGEFELDPELVRSLVATYPAVNVRRELERMHLWTLKNPARRWSNPIRGIEAWLKKASKAAAQRKENEKQQAKRTEKQYLQGVKTSGVSTAWWASDEGTLQRGRQMSIYPRPGESMSDYRTRLRNAA